MKKLLLGLTAAAVLAVPAAASAGNGTDFKECFDRNYGQSGLNYGQFKKESTHVTSGYGITGVLAAHGPNALAKLCG